MVRVRGLLYIAHTRLHYGKVNQKKLNDLGEPDSTRSWTGIIAPCNKDDVVVRVSHRKEGTHFGHLLSPSHTQNTCLFRGLGDGDTTSISPPVISALNQRMITHFEEPERKMPPQTIPHTGFNHYLSSGSLKGRARLSKPPSPAQSSLLPRDRSVSSLISLMR